MKFSITYSTSNDESASQGTYCDQGFIDENMEFASINEAQKYFENNYGVIDSYDSDDCWYSADADLDIDTGEQTTYGLHLN